MTEDSNNEDSLLLEERVKYLETMLGRCLASEATAATRAIESIQSTTVASVVSDEKFEKEIEKSVRSHLLSLASNSWKSWKSYAAFAVAVLAMSGITWVSIDRWVSAHLNSTFEKKIKPLLDNLSTEVATARKELEATQQSVRSVFADSLSSAALDVHRAENDYKAAQSKLVESEKQAAELLRVSAEQLDRAEEAYSTASDELASATLRIQELNRINQLVEEIDFEQIESWVEDVGRAAESLGNKENELLDLAGLLLSSEGDGPPILETRDGKLVINSEIRSSGGKTGLSIVDGGIQVDGMILLEDKTKGEGALQIFNSRSSFVLDFPGGTTLRVQQDMLDPGAGRPKYHAVSLYPLLNGQLSRIHLHKLP